MLCYIHLRSFSFILEEIEDGLGRDGEPDGGSCAQYNAVWLAGLSALMDGDSDANIVKPRKCGPPLAVRCTQACAKIGHHPLCKFHHAPLAFWGRDH